MSPILCVGGIREMFQDSGFYDKFPTEILYPTTHDAVLHALDNDPVVRQQVSHKSMRYAFICITFTYWPFLSRETAFLYQDLLFGCF